MIKGDLDYLHQCVVWETVYLKSATIISEDFFYCVECSLAASFYFRFLDGCDC